MKMEMKKVQEINRQSDDEVIESLAETYHVLKLPPSLEPLVFMPFSILNF